MAENNEFAPEQGMLQEILTILENSQSPDKNVIDQSQARLRQLNLYPEFNLYLCYILVSPSLASHTRSSAGIILKNNIQWSPSTFNHAIVNYIQCNVFKALHEPAVLVRRITANLISTLINSLEIQSWPEAVPTLIAMARTQEEHVSMGAWLTLSDICEDTAPDMCGYQNGVLVDQIVTAAIEFFDHSNLEIRTHALNASIQFIPSASPGFINNLEIFVQGIFKLASDEAPAVRQHVCTALVSLVETKLERTIPMLLPEMDAIIKFMLQCTQDDDEMVSLEACEFWLAMVEQEAVREYLVPVMNELLPVLLRLAQLSDLELIALKVDVDDDAHEEDQAQDIRPVVPKDHQRGSDRKHQSESSDNDDDDEEDEDFEDEDGTDWTIRKCAALTIDVLASNFGDGLLALLVPLLQEMLTTADWLLQEAAILAMGAISMGCDGMDAHLPQVIPLLVNYTKHPMFPLRKITCWTLGRYARFIASSDELFPPVLEHLLERLVDGNKIVQRAACVALARLFDQGASRLEDYATPILQTLLVALDRYQRKNYIMLCEVVSSFVEFVGPVMEKPEYLQPLMSALMKRWNSLASDDRELFAVHEVLSCVCTSVETEFLPYVAPLFQRALEILHENVRIEMARTAGQDVELPDKEFTISALDFISGLIEGLQETIEPLVKDTPLIELLLHCLQHNRIDVRQSAFAVFGDVSKSLYHLIEPYIEHVYPLLEDAISCPEPAVCNNAIWAAGELALHLKEKLAANIPALIGPLVVALDNVESETLAENAAMTLGRLAIATPEVIAQSLPTFFKKWCIILRQVEDNDEKESAFSGICNALEINPQAALPAFLLFCDAVNRFREPSEELIQRFGTILRGFKSAVGPSWDVMFRDYPQLHQSLTEKFQL
eukprot:m.200051 g.200051  ORF g.200051 m.200051 type:complete len:892 (+) comp17049_c0_seq1:98-2773(+)